MQNILAKAANQRNSVSSRNRSIRNRLILVILLYSFYCLEGAHPEGGFGVNLAIDFRMQQLRPSIMLSAAGDQSSVFFMATTPFFFLYFRLS